MYVVTRSVGGKKYYFVQKQNTTESWTTRKDQAKQFRLIFSAMRVSKTLGDGSRVERM